MPSSFGYRLVVAILATLLSVTALAEGKTLLYSDHPLNGQLWDMQAGRRIDEATLLERLASAQIVLLGETHDNPEHHRLQRRVLEARIKAGGSPALAMEQFDVEYQKALDQARGRGGDADAIAAAGNFAKTWGWEQYRPLIVTALDRQLPIIAANLSRERIRPVIRGGFPAFDAGELARLHVEAAWSEGRQAYLAGLIEDSHCGQIDATLRDGLIRGQRLRDAVMADVMLAQTGRGVVAILGRGHARRDIAVPRYIEVRQPGTRTLSIALVEVSPDKTTPEAYESDRADDIVPYDILWFTARAERSDPCADFPKRQ